MIDYLSGCAIFADKGFIGLEWQTNIFVQTNDLIWTPKRSNHQVQNSKKLDRFLSSVRERIEGVFHEIQNTVKYQVEFDPLSVNEYQRQYEAQQIRYMQKRAAKLGCQLVPALA